MRARAVRWVTGAFAVLVIGLLLVPAATAALVSKHSFTTGLPASEFGNQTQANPLDRLGLVSGGLTWEGDERGVFAFSDAATFRGLRIDQVEAINRTAVSESSGFQRLRFARGETFHDVSLSARPGSSLALIPDDATIAYECESEFSLATFIQLPADPFEDLDLSPGTSNGSHIVSSGRDQVCTMRQATSTSETFLSPLNDNSSIVLSPAGQEPRNYTGGDWVFRLRGTPDYEARADGVMAPFKTTSSGVATPYGGMDVSERFTMRPMQRLLDNLAAPDGDEEPGGEDSEDPLSNLRQIAPVLDGVLLGNLSQNVTVDGEPFKGAGWAFVRFERLELASAAAPNEVSVAGQGRLVLVDGDVYETRQAVELGPLHIPVMSIILWLVAVGAIFASYSLKPLVGADNVKSFGLIRLIGFLFHMVAFVAAFVLFDLEVKAVLGTSLLTILVAGGGGQGIALGLVAFFQLVPFGLAVLFFGLPMRFIANAALRFGGLNSAKGFGKGLGNLAVWGLGGLYLRVLLGGFLALALDLMGGMISGG